MTGPRVVMLLSNGYAPDLRVQKEAHTLALAGYRVTVIAWDRACTRPTRETEPLPPPLARELAGRAAAPGEVSVVRIPVPGGYHTGRRLLLSLPRFWRGALTELRRLHPAVVHAHDLDTLLPGWISARRHGARLVYDAHEYYPGMVRASVGGPLSSALKLLERTLAPRADVVITTGERLAARFRSMGARVTIVPNSQPLPGREVDSAAANLRRSLDVPADALVIVYVGMLNADRLIAPLLEAAGQVDQVRLVIGGTGPQQAQVEQAARTCPRIHWLGWVEPASVPEIVAAGDVVYYGLDGANPNAAYMVPNLVYFALAAPRPVLITPVGEAADLVRRVRGGMVLDDVSSGTLARALWQLCDPQLRATLTFRADRVEEVVYRWNQAADRLLNAYAGLSCQ